MIDFIEQGYLDIVVQNIWICVYLNKGFEYECCFGAKGIQKA